VHFGGLARYRTSDVIDGSAPPQPPSPVRRVPIPNQEPEPASAGDVQGIERTDAGGQEGGAVAHLLGHQDLGLTSSSSGGVFVRIGLPHGKVDGIHVGIRGATLAR
jgi:hypothetical protein